MNNGWILAFSCGAALLLGACSGGGSPEGGDSSSAEAAVGGAAASAPVRASQEAVDAAEAAYTEAQAAVAAAVAAANAASTDAARTAARAAIANARSKLDAAVSAANAAVSAARDDTVRAAAQAAVARATALQTSQSAVLDTAAAGTSWSGRALVPVAIPEPAWLDVVERTRRRIGVAADSATDTVRLGADDNPDLLKSADLPVRFWEDGKIVMAEGQAGSGERLFMRGMPIIYTANNRLVYRPSLNADTAAQVDLDLPSLQNNRPALLAGLTIGTDSLVVDMGGKGAPGLDFRVDDVGLAFNDGLYFVPGRATSGNVKGFDLKLDFGRPSASPQGNAEYFWEGRLEPTPAQVTAAGGATGWLKDGTRTRPLGVYHVRLSNHLGLDVNREDSNGPAYPDDDENFYLTHAAYGFMDFFRPGTSASTASGEHHYHRVFPFHVGYDAFKDESERRTTDIAAADAILGGTFKGRTMAVRFQVQARGLINVDPGTATRLRGDIELTATISGTQANNTITGKIMNMEEWNSQRGWVDSTIMPHNTAFNLASGQIGADGEFAGIFSSLPTGYGQGGYRGNFYGPAGSLEAAGTWAMSRPTAGSGNNWGIAGSFGAAQVRDDGTYGTTVTGGGIAPQIARTQFNAACVALKRSACSAQRSAKGLAALNPQIRRDSALLQHMRRPCWLARA